MNETTFKLFPCGLDTAEHKEVCSNFNANALVAALFYYLPIIDEHIEACPEYDRYLSFLKSHNLPIEDDVKLQDLFSQLTYVLIDCFCEFIATSPNIHMRID